MKLVTGVFEAVGNAGSAVQALLDAGFASSDIGIATRDSSKGIALAERFDRTYLSGETATARQPVTSELCVLDRLPDEFVSLAQQPDMPADALDWYLQYVARDNILVMVNAGERAGQARSLLLRFGGLLYGPQERMMSLADGEELRIPIVDEELRFEKTPQAVGEILVRTEVTSQAVDVPMISVRDEVHIDRRVLETPMTLADYEQRPKAENEICIPIVTEELHVVKEVLVNEELLVSALPVVEQVVVHESAGHTEAYLEIAGNVDLLADTSVPVVRRAGKAAWKRAA